MHHTIQGVVYLSCNYLNSFVYLNSIYSLFNNARLYRRGSHNGARACHWRGLHKIPLIMFGFEKQSI
jgi:hypothetical protein